MKNSICRSAPDDGRQEAAHREAVGYSCAVSGYPGLEHEVARLRNASRSGSKTRADLDWRYRRLPGAPEPKVFWLVATDGARVGMASVIWRPYWLRGTRVHVGVLGDISLDARLRGQGLGRQLLDFVTAYLDKHGMTGFVIPTEAARRTLTSIGWNTCGAIVPHVLLLDPSARLERFLGRIPAGLAGRIYRQLLRLTILGASRARQETLEVVAGVPDSCQVVWNALDKDRSMMQERSLMALRWRYADHPTQAFSTVTLFRAGVPAAYAIFCIEPADGFAVIYDFQSIARADARPLLAGFVRHCLTVNGLNSIRFAMSDKHPHAGVARHLGFLPRPATAVFQTYAGRAADGAMSLPWAVTAGDKDI